MGDNSNNEDDRGLRLLVNHIAKIKLEKEELDYNSRNKIEKLEMQLLLITNQLDDSLNLNSKLKEKIKSLEKTTSTKYRIEEREELYSQIKSLKQSKFKLKKQMEEYKLRLSEYETDENTKINGNSSSSSSDDDDEQEDKDKIIDELKKEIEMKSKAIESLKNKLDLELELKWNRKQENNINHNGGAGGVLNSISNFIAPLP